MLCCVKRVNLRRAKRSLHLSILGKNSFLGIGRALWWMSEGVMHFRVSHQSQCGLYQKTKSNCLSENKMLSTLIWRHVSLLYVVQSNILWRTILLSYHCRCNVVFTNYRFPVSFLLYIATQTLTNHNCEQFYEYSYHQKNNSCTLCVPMFVKTRRCWTPRCRTAKS